MKSGELIRRLQEHDPTGECHVRINGEPIYNVDSKPGYWDGPYNFLEHGEDGKPVWVQSTRGTKLDIDTIDLFGFAEKFNGDWEEMKKHIRVDYDYLDSKHENEFMESALTECEEYRGMIEEIERRNRESGKS